MAPRSAQAWVSAIATAFEKRGWRDEYAALAIAAESQERGAFDGEAVAAVIPQAFLDLNGVGEDEVVEAVRDVVGGWTTVPERPALLPIGEIDSFARASEIDPKAVASFVTPLDVPEERIKELIAKTVGEPYLEKDWGGERKDLLTGRVTLGGKPVQAAFLLKGPGAKGQMVPATLGSRGDQLYRLFTVPADLYVVQHVDRVDESVRDQLRRAVVSDRVEGKDVIGSIWDGSDTARLLVAHGFLDSKTGKLTA